MGYRGRPLTEHALDLRVPLYGSELELITLVNNSDAWQYIPASPAQRASWLYLTWLTACVLLPPAGGFKLVSFAL